MREAAAESNFKSTLGESRWLLAKQSKCTFVHECCWMLRDWEMGSEYLSESWMWFLQNNPFTHTDMVKNEAIGRGSPGWNFNQLWLKVSLSLLHFFFAVILNIFSQCASPERMNTVSKTTQMFTPNVLHFNYIQAIHYGRKAFMNSVCDDQLCFSKYILIVPFLVSYPIVFPQQVLWWDICWHPPSSTFLSFLFDSTVI